MVRYLCFDDFKGQYIYVDIWASWCLPCRQEAPFFEALKERYKAKNLVFLSLSIDESESDWRGFLQNRKVYDHQF
jgi:thiol-disulfide isomerase/thioredoxin